MFPSSVARPQVIVVLLVLLPAACDPVPSANSPGLVAVPGAGGVGGERAGAGCTLEAAIATFGNPSIPRSCGQPQLGADGVCDDACKASVRRCVFESGRALQPFLVSWTNAMVNGVGTRRAVVGRVASTPDGSPALEVTWLDYVWSSAFDAHEATMTGHRIRISARRCFEITDLTEACAGAGPPACAQPEKKISDDASMWCEGGGEVFCSE